MALSLKFRKQGPPPRKNCHLEPPFSTARTPAPWLTGEAQGCPVGVGVGQLAPERCPVRELADAQVHRAVGTKMAQEREVGLGVSGHRPRGGPKSVQEEGPRMEDGELDLQTPPTGDAGEHSGAFPVQGRGRKGQRARTQFIPNAEETGIPGNSGTGWQATDGVLNPAHHLFLQIVLLELSHVGSLCLFCVDFMPTSECSCLDGDLRALKDGLPGH